MKTAKGSHILHLCEVLGLDPVTTKRIVFHEITKPAISQPSAGPDVGYEPVNAQQARRILDRNRGIRAQPVLWRKMSMKNNSAPGGSKA